MFWHWLTLKISNEDILNKGFLVTLTEHQKVGWILIKLHETDIAESDFTLMKPALLQVILTMNNHWIDSWKYDSGSNITSLN